MELHVKEDWCKGETYFFLKTHRGDADVFIGMRDGQLVEESFAMSNPVVRELPALLRMPARAAEEFIAAFANYLSNKGIVTENESLLKGKLLATEKHLEDMRRHFDTVLNKIVL